MTSQPQNTYMCVTLIPTFIIGTPTVVVGIPPVMVREPVAAPSVGTPSMAPPIVFGAPNALPTTSDVVVTLPAIAPAVKPGATIGICVILLCTTHSTHHNHTTHP